MKLHRILIASLLAALVTCSQASAGVTHIVRPGETLWSIAAANNFTTRSLAAANGLSENAQVVIGSKLTIPTESEAAAALQKMGIGGGSAAATTTSGGPAPLGSYVVRPGDTLSAIAERSGVTLDAVAFMNGLDPKKPLLIGTVLKLPSGSNISTSAPAPTQREVPNAPPYPTPERVSAWRDRPDRRGAGRAGLARQGDRLAGERLQQQPRVRGQRPRRDADPARHLVLDQQQPGGLAR